MTEAAEARTVRWGARPRALVTVAVALALVLRLGLIADTPGFKPIHDAADFDRMARSIADTGHYPDTYFAKPGTATALNPPGYPHLLALTYTIAGRSLTAGRVLGALLGMVTVLLMALIAWRLWGPTAGVLAGFLGAFYPPLVMTNASLISEALFLPLMLGLVLLLVTRPQVEGSAALAVAVVAGVLCGLAALTRFVGVLLVIVVLIWILQRRLTARRRLAMGALAVLAASATIAPWTIRNAVAFHAFVPIATEGGAGAVGTYNADSARAGPLRGTWRPEWQLGTYRRLFNDGLNEAQLDQRWRSDALRYARRHPSYPFVALGLNSLRMFGFGPGYRYLEGIWYTEMGIPQRAHRWTRVSVYGMALLALLGVIVGRPLRRRRDAFLWLIPILLFLAPAFFLGGPRYRVPVDPFLVLLAVSGLAALAARSSRAERAPAVTKTAAA
jgi:4-amino-4-deoxy-L-arabinose transferase-like glycosyltransferase